MAWDGKKTEKAPSRHFVCAGCGKVRHPRYGATLVKLKHFMVHNGPECRQLKAAKARIANGGEAA